MFNKVVDEKLIDGQNVITFEELTVKRWGLLKSNANQEIMKYKFEGSSEFF